MSKRVHGNKEAKKPKRVTPPVAPAIPGATGLPSVPMGSTKPIPGRK